MRTLRLAAAVTALTAAATLTPVASAAPVDAQAVRQVCARDLYVRATAAGVVIGTLYYGENFDVQRYSPSGQWVFGHAYGNVHQDGWVQNGWFC
ncbi:hypothetical protein IOD16_23240 [Saccharothrix sp. 6-C]|uniref:hypothetical protein n=1 Tax=Saccharothrix sp. 6-C TaxID=2781735 RepID=UPI0019173A18|nr:hypothetical protein [Saccharothrix sp. 6-C]QQQ74129.1 hypothetical protein IOD16_23240 [Saccharothrix sp. 6-C]